MMVHLDEQLALIGESSWVTQTKTRDSLEAIVPFIAAIPPSRPPSAGVITDTKVSPVKRESQQPGIKFKACGVA